MNIKNHIHTFCAGICLLLNFNLLHAQEAEEKHKPSVMLGVSAMKFRGYVGNNSTLNPMLDTRLGYFLTIEQRFGKVLGVQLTGLYGKLAGTDDSPTSHLNFQSQIMQGHIMLTINFDKVMKGDPMVTPFINAGIGYMLFNSYTDITNAAGDTLHYWKDGSARNVSEGAGNVFTSKILDRDYVYETKLKANNVTGTLVIPVGGGLNFHFGKNWAASVGANYNICLTTWIDGTGKSSNSYISANVGLQYEFKGKDKEKASYSNIDFANVDHLDADKDGVPDDRDNCHGTPSGVAVDGGGCPVDTDKDGVPDYLDKEPNSLAGVKVDGFGVTINEKEILAHQKAWSDMASERSKEFNVMPSAEYLKKIEKESQKANAGKKTKVIPEDLKIADTNHDGRISAAEITNIINAFFEGSNDVSIDTINRLIEFFFE